MFSRQRTFAICKYTSTKEEDVVKMLYEKKIECDKTELLEQRRSA